MSRRESSANLISDVGASLSRPRVFAPLLLAIGATVSWWHAGRGLPFPDEGAQLTAASKILLGAVFYRDLDAYPLPGSVYLLALALKLFGSDLAVARNLAAGLFCVTLMALYTAALSLMSPPRAALFGLSLLVFKLISWPAFTGYIYADVAFTAACLSIAFFLAGPRNGVLRLALAGLFAGLSLVSKQNLGIYLGGASLLILWHGDPAPDPRRSAGGRWKRMAIFAGAGALPLVAMSSYFAAHGVLAQMMESAFLRPFTGYLPTAGVSFGRMLAWWNFGELRGHLDSSTYMPHDYSAMLGRGHLPAASQPIYWYAGEFFSRALYTLIPGVLLWTALRWLRTAARERSHRDHALLTLGALAGASLASAFPRADFFHVISVFPVVWLLLFALRRPADGHLANEAFAVGVALLVAAGLAVHYRNSLTHRVSLDRAVVDVHPSQAWAETLVETVRKELRPGEPLFVYGHEAQFYFLTDRYFEWPFSQLYPGQEGGDGGREVARRLAANPPRMVLRGLMYWPSVPPVPRSTPEIKTFLERSYRPDPGFFDRRVSPGTAPDERAMMVWRLRGAGGRARGSGDLQRRPPRREAR